MFRIHHYLIVLAVFSHLIFFVSGCKEPEYNIGSILNPEYYEKVKPQPIIEADNSLDRSIWQKPGLVVRKIGDVSDKVIADIGVGTGFFLFKIAPRSKQWIAIDIDPKYIIYIDSVKNTLPPEIAAKIITRMASPDNPNLKINEVDIVLIINTVAYIPDLPRYFENLKKYMKDDAEVIIIDYKMKQLPINAPPRSERIYLDQLEMILTSAGYEIMESDDTSLDFQYIIKAKKAEAF